MAHIIVVGNEKGGAGKSTVSMHLATALARLGFRTGALDLDVRQKSFHRYLENRARFMSKEGLDLPSPIVCPLPDIEQSSLPPGKNIQDERLSQAAESLHSSCDFVVIDCPGSHTRLSQLAHSMADTLVTPLNDSFIDFDLLAHIDPDTNKTLGPSIYSEMVWAARQLRAESGLKATDWVVLRNRVGAQFMHNKRKVASALDELSRRIGFRHIPGFSERVVFRELFPRGLTLLDLKDVRGERLNISNITARQELRDMLRDLNLPGVKPNF